jgi:ABC-type Fe3+ transport system permease subunit
LLYSCYSGATMSYKTLNMSLLFLGMLLFRIKYCVFKYMVITLTYAVFFVLHAKHTSKQKCYMSRKNGSREHPDQLYCGNRLKAMWVLFFCFVFVIKGFLLSGYIREKILAMYSNADVKKFFSSSIKKVNDKCTKSHK